MAAPKGNKYAIGNDGGRPSKYKEEFCQMLIEHMESGLSYESFAGVLSVCRDTLYEWEKSHKEFFDTKKIGKEKLLLFFEKIGRAATAGKIKGFNATSFVWCSKNMIGWKDQIENTTDIKDINVNIKEWAKE